jgi:hypothetical protein
LPRYRKPSFVQSHFPRLRGSAAGGCSPQDEYDSYEEWLFNDAARALRIDAIDKIPELFEKLTNEVAATTKALDKKLHLLEEWASAISTDSVHTVKELGTGQVGKK